MTCSTDVCEYLRPFFNAGNHIHLGMLRQDPADYGGCVIKGKVTQWLKRLMYIIRVKDIRSISLSITAQDPSYRTQNEKYRHLCSFSCSSVHLTYRHHHRRRSSIPSANHQLHPLQALGQLYHSQTEGSWHSEFLLTE